MQLKQAAHVYALKSITQALHVCFPYINKGF